MVATLSSKGSFKINHLYRFINGFFMSTPEIRQNQGEIKKLIMRVILNSIPSHYVSIDTTPFVYF